MLVESDAALTLYANISSLGSIDQMIADGETEGLHLECKAPTSPRLTKDQKHSLERIISGFSNTAGGIILWGVSTTKHEHSGLDVLTQIEEIGNVASFAKSIEATVPILTTPAVINARHKILKRKRANTRGVVVTHIPHVLGDPIQSVSDSKFYYSNPEGFVVAPYDMVKRLFAATESPDLRASVNLETAELDTNGTWKIPLRISNQSSAIAEHIHLGVEVLNGDLFESIQCPKFTSVSALNPNRDIYSVDPLSVVHRGFNLVLGNILVRVKPGKGAKRRLDIRVELFANKMRARSMTLGILLYRSGVRTSVIAEDYLY